MRQLYVIGDPVAHSLSPLIQRAMIRQTGAAYRYDVRTVRPDELADFVAWARDGGCAGCNVTMPLKEAIVPLLDDGRVIVERQFRYPVNEVITEIPAGKRDSRSEAPEAAARRELREETGITARELLPLGPFYPAAAYSDEVIWMYLARGLTFGEQQLDDDEFLNLQAVPLEELARDVLAGRIPDAKTQAAILRVYCMEHGYEPK